MTDLLVQLELNADTLNNETDPSRWVMEKCRDEADKLCEQYGARLRTDHPVDFAVTHGENRITGERCVLVVSRWAVIAPATVPVRRPRR